MLDYKLNLVIAELPIVLHLFSIDEKNFAVEKYKDYLQVKKNSNSYSKEYHIFLNRDQSSVIKVKGNDYYLPIKNIRYMFLRFNDFFRYAVVNILSKNNGLVLHGSCLIKNRKGFIFIGKEGSGKSSIRKLNQEHTALGDDSAIIRKIDSKYYLFGSPFYQKTKICYPNLKVEVSSIFTLKKKDINSIVKLDFSMSLSSFLNNSFYAALDKSEKQRIIKICFAISKLGKLFQLAFKKNGNPGILIDENELNSLSRLSVKKTINKINKNIKTTTKKVLFESYLVTSDILNNCIILKEASWNFEFSAERSIKTLSQRVFDKSYKSSHAEIIKNKFGKIKLKKLREMVLILIKYKGKHVIVDGNHTAVALYRYTKVNNIHIPLLVLIGKLPRANQSLMKIL